MADRGPPDGGTSRSAGAPWRPELDIWLADPALRVAHRSASRADPEALWRAAREVRLADTGLLGRLIRWRIPGTPAEMRFDELFRTAPFTVLQAGDGRLVCGLVGPIWTLRRDYLPISGPVAFARARAPGTARVVFAHWVEPRVGGGGVFCSEARVEAVGRRGRVGVAAVRPLVTAFQHLVASEGIAAAVRLAERG